MARSIAAERLIRWTLGVGLALQLFSAWAQAESSCVSKVAVKALEQGKALQAELETDAALLSYQRCLKAEPECVACLYEIGWSYWKQGRWDDVIRTWELAQKFEPTHPEIKQFLPTAKENQKAVETHQIPKSFRNKVELAIRSKPEDGPVSLIFTARRQSYNRSPSSPLDFYDNEIHSPKSVHFSTDGKQVYVNSLESGKTVIYETMGFQRVASIPHKFGPEEAKLFDSQPIFDYRFPKTIRYPNRFTGKPVELELTHKGKYLWVPYYRRSFDADSSMPSAIAIVDTSTREIVRVLGSGPISKYVKASPSGHWMAVSHWGDNSVGLIDIRAKDPKRFRRAGLLVVEKRLNLKKIKGDRDKVCGFCVRGLAFTADEKHLFVSRMKGGGIAIFRLDPGKKKKHRYLGTVFGVLPGPRDLETSRDGKWLYASCNSSGHVARLPIEGLLKSVEEIAKGETSVTVDREELGAQLGYVGLGARSIRLSPDERFLFVAVNQTSEVVVLSTETMKIIARIPVDSYPVGLDLSPDGQELWVTSQGRNAKGGNSVGIFQVRYKDQEVVHSR